MTFDDLEFRLDKPSGLMVASVELNNHYIVMVGSVPISEQEKNMMTKQQYEAYELGSFQVAFHYQDRYYGAKTLPTPFGYFTRQQVTELLQRLEKLQEGAI